MPDRGELMAAAQRGSTEEEKTRREGARFGDQARTAGSRHAERLRALEAVFGPAVRAAAEEHLETLVESSSEAIYFLGRALEYADAERDELRAELSGLRARLTNRIVDADRARELPEIIVERAERYFVHTRRARPTWLRDAVAEIRRLRTAVSASEPF